MKYIKKLYSFIFEKVESYEFYLTSDDESIHTYEFYDKMNNRYLVEFKKKEQSKKNKISTIYELLYYVYDSESYSVSKIVNVNPYKVLQTIFGDILSDFIKRCPLISQIYFIGLAKEKEKEFITSRTKIYKRYLDMNPPDGFIIKQIGNTIQIKKQDF